MQSSQNNNLLNKLKKMNLEKYMVYIIFVVVFILFSIFLGDRGFLSTTNLLNVLRQTSMIAIMSVAGTFLLGAGQIDLSVGSVAAMSAMLVSLTIEQTNSIVLSVLVGLIFGVLLGLLNGLLVTKLKIPAFLTTLGTMQIVRGGGYVDNRYCSCTNHK